MDDILFEVPEGVGTGPSMVAPKDGWRAAHRDNSSGAGSLVPTPAPTPAPPPVLPAAKDLQVKPVEGGLKVSLVRA